MATVTRTTLKTIRAHQTTTSTRTQPPTLSRALGMRYSPERTRTGPQLANRTHLRHWKNISVCPVVHLCLDQNPLTRRPQESLRYLDQHHALPDDTPPQREVDFDELRTVLLNNSALAALRAQPPDPTLAVHQTTRAHLLAIKIEHKGWSYPLCGPAGVFTGNHRSKSTLPSSTRQGGTERRRRCKERPVGSQHSPRDRRPSQP